MEDQINKLKGLRIVTIKVLCKPGVDRKDIFTDKVYHLA